MNKSLTIKKSRTGAKGIVIFRRIEEILKVVLIVAIIIAINEISNRVTNFVVNNMTFSQIKLCFFVAILIFVMYFYLKSCAEIKKIVNEK